MKARISLEYFVLDVFSDKSYKGNPLAVVFTNGNLELNEYQNISKEFGYSETSFVYYSLENKALDVRSFTPTGVEVDGAGHNLLGAVCAALIKGVNIFEEQDEANRFVMMKDTPISLQATFDKVNQTAVAQMQQKSAIVLQTIPSERIAKALGLTIDDLKIDNLVPTVIQTEIAHTMVPIKNPRLLNSCMPDNKQLIEISKQYQFEGFYCFTFPGQDQDHFVESRFFNPLIGINEDAATGTAAGPLVGFLANNNYIQLNKQYKILQGVKLNQPSLIETMVRDSDILVGGSSILTMRGEIYL
ncbi:MULTISPECIES: PhzF family phenazine biosynthesis protein [Niastella]|uniref:PhzF family phenazine biosynthesis protein n=1 Tax=Niastella soli TaxID=2821487 RepID=A0ABS3YYR7_9BACT|nr:PhzF family phenazine biosynthesis protein [Niastella soli]MBO9203076.1 PhzF family phenazine biosynthesis protein [Niastella soli]